MNNRKCPDCGRPLLSQVAPLCCFCGAKIPETLIDQTEKKLSDLEDEYRKLINRIDKREDSEYMQSRINNMKWSNLGLIGAIGQKTEMKYQADVSCASKNREDVELNRIIEEIEKLKKLQSSK